MSPAGIWTCQIKKVFISTEIDYNNNAQTYLHLNTASAALLLVVTLGTCWVFSAIINGATFLFVLGSAVVKNVDISLCDGINEDPIKACAPITVSYKTKSHTSSDNVRMIAAYIITRL